MKAQLQPRVLARTLGELSCSYSWVGTRLDMSATRREVDVDTMICPLARSIRPKSGLVALSEKRVSWMSFVGIPFAFTTTWKEMMTR